MLARRIDPEVREWDCECPECAHPYTCFSFRAPSALTATELVAQGVRCPRGHVLEAYSFRVSFRVDFAGYTVKFREETQHHPFQVGDRVAYTRSNGQHVEGVVTKVESYGTSAYWTALEHVVQQGPIPLLDWAAYCLAFDPETQALIGHSVTIHGSRLTLVSRPENTPCP